MHSSIMDRMFHHAGTLGGLQAEPLSRRATRTKRGGYGPRGRVLAVKSTEELLPPERVRALLSHAIPLSAAEVRRIAAKYCGKN